MARSIKDLPPELATAPDVSQIIFVAWLNGAPAADIPFLKPEHFHDHRDRDIWRVMLEMEEEGLARDVIALAERLKRTSKVDYVNWETYLVQCMLAIRWASASNMEEHAGTVYGNWRRRQIYNEHAQKACRALDLSIPLTEEEEALPKPTKDWTVAELLETEFGEPRGLWPGVIPPGLTVIGARPKFGKSLLMLQVSGAVGAGGMLFDQQVEQRPVLYYALEDSPRRLKERLSRLAIPAEAKINFRREIKPLHLGGLAHVDAAAQDYGLIVIDTIARAVPGQDFSREAALFGDLLGQLQTTALDHDMSIVTVMHTRKPNGMDHDPVDDVLGSTQMTAAADCVLAIYRDAAAGKSRLKGRGRDLEDIDLTMEFDPSTVCWQLVGRTSDLVRTESEADILEVLRLMGRTGSAEIARVLEKDRRNTNRRLAALWTQGKCKRDLVDGQFLYYLDGTPR